MADESEQTQLLRILIRLVGRSVMPPEHVLKIVASKGSSDKQLRAYNLCDGTRTQAQIVNDLHLDQGNFSRSLARWEAAGVVFGLGSGRERKLLHVYPLESTGAAKKEPKS